MTPQKSLYAWIKNFSFSAYIGLLAFCVICLVFFLTKPKDSNVGIYVPAIQSTELTDVGTVPVTVEFIKVFAPEAKQKLSLSKEVQQNKSKHVVSSTKVKGDENPHTITTLVDSSTGEFTTYDRKDPPPWVAVNTTTHIAAYYGIKNTTPIVRLQAQQELLRLKALKLEGNASIDMGAGKPDTFIGIGGRFSF